jgi:hypothetical protein
MGIGTIKFQLLRLGKMQETQQKDVHGKDNRVRRYFYR